MAVSPPVTPTPKPQMPRSWRWLLRVTGALALILFLTPTVFVVKYFAFDRPRAAVRTVPLTILRNPVPSETVAPPLRPTAPGNGADFYVRALQLWADRPPSAPMLPTHDEAATFLEGARRTKTRFFAADPNATPLFVFHDPDLHGAPTPYRFPVTAREPYRYLGAAIRLTQALARIPLDGEKKAILGRAIVRFGDALEKEAATETHLIVANGIEKTGLRLLLPTGGNPLRTYVIAQQKYIGAVQDKYGKLEKMDADNLLLQTRVLREDADPLWRREAAWALGANLSRANLSWRRPLESVQAKAALSASATADPDPSVRAASSETLGEIARRGAIIQR